VKTIAISHFCIRSALLPHSKLYSCRYYPEMK
jgi:hypothetical protein